MTKSDSISANSMLHNLLWLSENDPMTAQELQSVRLTLVDLARMGVAAVPVIRAFLDGGDNSIFNTGYSAVFEFSSLRIALFDVLRQIGGFQAEQVLLEQLNTDGSVTELAAIADALEWLQPGFYTESILEVAVSHLAALSVTRAPDQRTESRPLFEVLQNYGDIDMAPILYQVPYWLQDYAQVALANLPDERGVAGLAQKARRDLTSSRDNHSLHLLAQVAVTKPQAEQALLVLMHSGHIPDSFWPTMGEILMGDRQLQIEDPSLQPESLGSLRGDNPYAIHTIVDRQVQIIYSVNYSATLSSEAVSARVGLISRLMSATSNPSALIALMDARVSLEDYYWSY